MATPLPDGIGREALALHPGRARLLSLLPLIVLGAILLLALAGLFGGKATDWRSVRNDAVELQAAVPQVMRSGVLFEFRFRITPRRRFEDLRLALSPELLRDFTINTTIPEPGEQESKDGLFHLSYGPAEPGETIEVKIDGQINPALVWGTEGRIAVFDGDSELASMPLEITVLP
ncbi:MAG: hypothetical protein ACT4N8_11680 [Sphingosinicella sp.]|uniref:hypothetical protein n=1 Tax=Sphingosinicella sp. TaxID=1917971 RepID=UPI004037F20E